MPETVPEKEMNRRMALILELLQKQTGESSPAFPAVRLIELLSDPQSSDDQLVFQAGQVGSIG